MSSRNRYEVHLEAGTDEERPGKAPLPDGVFRIALLGDFSGRANRGVGEAGDGLARRRPLLVDRDNLDEVLGRLAPAIGVRPGSDESPRIELRFARMEDFHPDGLYERLPSFQALAQTRKRLADPARFAKSAGQLLAETSPKSSEVEQARPASSEELLDQILELTSPATPAPSASLDGDLQAQLKHIVRPYLVPNVDPRQEDLLGQVDKATNLYMRQLLHHPEFQSLEALWRAVFFLTRRVETSAQLQLYLIDVSKAELVADQAADVAIDETGLYRLLVESTVGTPGASEWAVFAGGYAFGRDEQDLRLLPRLAALAKLAGAPWISAAHPRLFGRESFGQTPDPADWSKEPDPRWEAVRRGPDASWLGLALPRFLLRLPYGSETDSCEFGEFDEFEGLPLHEEYLWGNTAFACIALLAESFSTAGWQFHPGMHRDIRGLPLHLIKTNGEIQLKPCAETLLTDRAAQRISECGLMPLLTLQESDVVRLLRFQSIAFPSASLTGRWVAHGSG